jgi:hypothetical protein
MSASENTWSFDGIVDSVSDFVGSVGDGVSGLIDDATSAFNFDGDGPLDAIGSGMPGVGKPMLQYPETLGASSSNSMYESDPEKDDSWMAHTPDKGDDAIISSKTNDPFISFQFKEISTTMDDVKKKEFESTKLVKGVLISKGVGALTSTLLATKNTSPGDTNIAKNTASILSNAAAFGYIANAVATMAKSIDSKPVRHTTARVSLYMPASIQISDSAEYSPTSNKALAYAGELSNKLRDADGNITATSAFNAFKEGDFGGDVGVGLAAAAGETIMGGGLIGAAASKIGLGDMSMMASMGESIKLVSDEELRMLGKAINPNDYMQFKSINLRQFSLSFKFLPDSMNESLQVRDIIKQFRKSMYPIKHSAITMTVPDILEIKFHNVMGMVKLPEVALTNVNINYNPNSASFFKHSGQPVEISMDIQLQEIHPIHRKDVEEGF